MATRPSSPMWRRRPRRFASGGARRVGNGLRRNGRIDRREARGDRAAARRGGAGSECLDRSAGRHCADANGRHRDVGVPAPHPRAPSAGRAPPRGPAVPNRALAHDGSATPGVGRRSSQASRLHRPGRRPPQPAPARPVAGPALERLLLPTRSADRDTIRKFAPDLAEDRLDRAVFSKGIVGPGLGTALLCLLLGIGPGLIAALAHAVLYVVVLAPLINGVGHWRGAQNFTNTAYNSAVPASGAGGERLHHNHHAEPRAPKFSVRRIEFDPSWLVIRALAAVKLVVVGGPPLRLSGHSRAIR